MTDQKTSAEHTEEPQNNKQAPPWIFFLVLPILVIGGFFVAIEQLKDYRNQIDAAQRFTPIEATILESRVKAVQSHRSSAQMSRTGYIPHIRYRYVVDGQGYKRNKYAYFHVNLGKSQAQDIVNQYPVGARIHAFIDPENPKRAALNIDKPENAWLMLAFFATFAAFVLGIGTFLLRQFMKERQNRK